MNLLSGIGGTGAAPALPASLADDPALAAGPPPAAGPLPAALVDMPAVEGPPAPADVPPAPPVELFELPEWQAIVAAQAVKSENSEEREYLRDGKG